MKSEIRQQIEAFARNNKGELVVNCNGELLMMDRVLDLRDDIYYRMIDKHGIEQLYATYMHMCPLDKNDSSYAFVKQQFTKMHSRDNHEDN